jgi:ABC-2 type transport system ATP-binding protein
VSTATPALAVRGLVKRYGRVTALGGVDLHVAPGELVGLLGPNGAGKSTLVKVVCGLVRPTEGTAHVLGHPAGSRPARAAIGYLAELFRFPPWATAEEVLLFHQRLTGSAGGSAERRDLLDRVGLPDAARTRVERMSKGMQQRLGIAQAMVGDPRLLLLDEPTSALDPVGRRLVRGLLADLRGRGVAVLLNSHLLSEVELVCDRVVIVNRGAVVRAGRVDELSRPRGVEIDTERGTEAHEGVSPEDVPDLVARLVGEGRRISGVRVLAPHLEDVYVAAVEGDTS